jgi:drug/metabolite transporter (DMT)-like permease
LTLPARSPLRGKVLVAYLTLCLVWGATFLAIRVGVRTFPPALLAGIRFLSAGLILLLLSFLLGRKLPRRPEDWKTAGIVGLLLITLGNGLTVAGTRFVDSGTAAMLVAGGALWMALLDAVIPGSEARVTWIQFAGILVGYSGTLLLIGGNLEALRRADWRGPFFFIATNICWGAGSVYSKRHPVETSPEMHAALQMTVGGAALLVIGTFLGEWKGFAPTPVAWTAMGFLIVFGSVVGYSCFVYVLRHTSPTITATYYYVNTLVAVILGWAFLGEHVGFRTLVAMFAILGSVISVQHAPKLITRRSSPVHAD